MSYTDRDSNNIFGIKYAGEPSKDECIIEHSKILNESGYYTEAAEYRDDPYKYLECIAPTYASDTDYYDSVETHINKYMDWDGKEDIKP